METLTNVLGGRHVPFMVTRPPTICSDGLIDIVGESTFKVAGIGYVLLFTYVYVKLVVNTYVPGSDGMYVAVKVPYGDVVTVVLNSVLFTYIVIFVFAGNPYPDTFTVNPEHVLVVFRTICGTTVHVAVA
jgi:hypothetical protein